MPSYPKVTYKKADKTQQAQESQLYDNQYNTYPNLFAQHRTFGDSGSSLSSEGRDRYAWSLGCSFNGIFVGAVRNRVI